MFNAQKMLFKMAQVYVLSLLLASCNSSSNTENGNTDYFPLDKGLSWEYRYETALTGGTPTVKTLKIDNLGEQKLGDKKFKVRRTSNGTDYYFKQDESGIYRNAKRTIVETKAAFDASPRLVLPLPTPKKPGKSWSVITQSYTLHRVLPHYEPPFENTAHFYMTYSVVGVDREITVPAGVFKNCLLIEGQAQVDQHAGSNQGKGEIEITTREWYAPGTGLVKMERIEPLDGDVFKGGKIVMELLKVSRN